MEDGKGGSGGFPPMIKRLEDGKGGSGGFPPMIKKIGGQEPRPTEQGQANGFLN